MTENLREAAILTVVGVLVVFVSLITLMVAIIILTRLTSGKTAEAKVVVPPVGWQEGPSGLKEPGPGKEAIAAIAVSLARIMAETGAGRPIPKEKPGPPTRSSPWARAGRERLMRSRRKVGHRWGRSSR